jgi:GH15 family glucan-1,4-alpha-glucosidase
MSMGARAFLLLLLLAPTLLAGPPPGERSFRQVTTSNGMIAAVVNTSTGVVESVLPRIYQSYDSLHRVEPILSGLRLAGNATPDRIGYLQNTHIIRAGYGPLTIFYFAPFTTGERVFYIALEGGEKVVEQASFSWDGSAPGLRTVELTFPIPGGRVRRYLLFAAADSLRGEEADLRPSRARLQSYRGSLLDDEIQYMRMIIDGARLPRRLAADERRVAEQSISILKMAQVSQYSPEVRSRGQIVASLPPGIWNISWVRDGCYGVMALSRIGLHEEARDALRFFLRAEGGKYVRYHHADGVDYGVGRDYLPSVCRYFGNGSEESDLNENGPNIEFDGFGLFLLAYADYITRSRDTVFLRDTYPRVLERVARVVAGLVQPNGLVRHDSGPWERHLPGKQYAYTSAVCAAGLRDLARLARRFGGEEWRSLAAAAGRLQEGIRRHLVVGGKFIKGNTAARSREEYEYFDAATFETFALGVVVDTALFRSHLRVYEKRCGVGGGRGFFRVNGGDGYDSEEWVFLDLRIASAMAKFGIVGKADRLLKWVTAQSAANDCLIAELYGTKGAEYAGAIPMAGFGAGAYLLALSDLRVGASAAPTPNPSEAHQTGKQGER